MIAVNHFCGVLDTSSSDDTGRTWEAFVERAATSLSENSVPAVAHLRRGRAFLAAIAFSPTAAGPGERSDGFAVVAGDPLSCGEDEWENDVGRGIGIVGDALSAGDVGALVTTRGSFAAAAWNADDRRLVLATDKLGVRPLYLTQQGPIVAFATTLAAVIRIIGSRPKWDDIGLAQSMFFGQCLGERTPYSGISVLPSGTAAIVQPGRALEMRRYFDLAAVPPRDLDPDALEHAVDAAFVRAVRRRSRSPEEHAFLSGGLDSRLIVDTLRTLGRTVHTFSSSYPQSLDDVVAAEAAQRLGTIHVRHHRQPAERLNLDMDQYAAYARAAFPAMNRPGAKSMWSGDGGSVTLGHVYMTEANVEATAGDITPETIAALYPAVGTAPSHHLSGATLRRFKALAVDSAIAELRRLQHARRDRVLFLFAMANDQARHLHAHFEHLAESEIEFVTPFFDSDIAALIASLPIAPFLKHGVYNRILSRFHPRSAAFYWQAYPGHLPSGHPAPEAVTPQWSGSWTDSDQARAARIAIADRILGDAEIMSDGLLNPWILRRARWFTRLGSNRYGYEIDFSRRIAALYRPAGRSRPIGLSAE